jgi:hypothetical protein
MKVAVKVVRNIVGRTTNRATSSMQTVKRRAATSPISSAATREKTKTVIVKTINRRRGPPERARLVSKNAYGYELCTIESTTIELTVAFGFLAAYRLNFSHHSDLRSGGKRASKTFWLLVATLFPSPDDVSVDFVAILISILSHVALEIDTRLDVVYRREN